jgi:hypothetical protein
MFPVFDVLIHGTSQEGKILDLQLCLVILLAWYLGGRPTFNFVLGGVWRWLFASLRAKCVDGMMGWIGEGGICFVMRGVCRYLCFRVGVSLLLACLVAWGWCGWRLGR